MLSRSTASAAPSAAVVVAQNELQIGFYPQNIPPLGAAWIPVPVAAFVHPFQGCPHQQYLPVETSVRSWHPGGSSHPPSITYWSTPSPIEIQGRGVLLPLFPARSGPGAGRTAGRQEPIVYPVPGLQILLDGFPVKKYHRHIGGPCLIDQWAASVAVHQIHSTS